MGQQHGVVRRRGRQVRREALRVRRFAPFEREPLDRGAECLGNLGVALAERADRDAQDPIAGRAGVHDRCLERSRAGPGQQQDSTLGADQAARSSG